MMQNSVLCLGIDPNPIFQSFENFQVSVKRHQEAVRLLTPHLKQKILKINFSIGKQELNEI